MVDKTCIETNGNILRIKSDNATVLQTPFVMLSAAPNVIVGRDPATGLPAYAPAPEQPASAPLPIPIVPVVVPSGGDPVVSCDQTRCGAALAMTVRLQQLYQKWQFWINAAVSAVGTVSITALLSWLGTLIEGLILTERLASWLLVVFKRLTPLLKTLTGVELAGVLPDWDATTVDNVQRVFFCALQCSNGAVSVSAGDMTNVAGYMRVNTAAFLGNITSELLALICEDSTLGDWQAAILASDASTLCAGYSCV